MAIDDFLERFFVVVGRKRRMVLRMPIFRNEDFGKFFQFDEMVDERENSAGIFNFQ